MESAHTTTFTVKASHWANRADGRAALLIFPVEIAPRAFAFELNLQGIQALRRHLDEAEALLRTKPGQA
jgi:hypothetical protein